MIYLADCLDGDYYDPLHHIGIYTSMEKAKREVESKSEKLGAQTAYITVLEQHGEVFETIERLRIDYVNTFYSNSTLNEWFIEDIDWSKGVNE